MGPCCAGSSRARAGTSFWSCAASSTSCAVLVRGGAGEDDQKALARSIAQLDELFLLVVVGEFNSGKSAVVNALLGESAVEEGVTPTTSRIRLIKHGGERRRRPTGGGFEELTLPVKILREMNIVDTPGTNAVIEGHEALTREFVPRSDLVLFVTSADRPFTASERAFLEAIRNWGKKVVVAVNKIDILDQPQDIDRVVQFVREKLRAQLGLHPEVFAVSARRAQRIKAAGLAANPQAGGFDALEAWITGTLDDAERVRLKLLNPVGVGLRVLGRAGSSVAERAAVLDAEVEALQEIETQLGRQREELARELRPRLSEVDRPLLELERRADAFLERALGLGALGALLDRSGVLRAFERQVAAGLRPAVEKRVDGLVDALLSGEARLRTTVTDAFAGRQLLGAANLPAPVDAVPPPDRARLRDLLWREAQRALGEYDVRVEARRVAGAARRVAVGAVLLALGVIGVGLGALTLGASTTATTTALLLAAAVGAAGLAALAAQKRRERARLRERVERVRRRLTSALRGAVERQQEAGGRSVRDAIAPYERVVHSERDRLRARGDELAQLRAGLERLRGRIEALG
jgi:small GTP-binding protein